MYSHFMDEQEAALIQQDFEMMLLSSEATPVSAVIVRHTGGRVDEVFGGRINSSVSEIVVTGTAIQQIVKPTDREILAWGIISTGDCLFYMSNDFSVGNRGDDQVYFLTPDGLAWTPVPSELHAFQHYVRARIGGSQVGQAIPASLKKSS